MKNIMLLTIMELVYSITFGQIYNEIKYEIDNEIKYKMFCSALSNFSTAPNYLVVTVKNLNTGEIKQICTEAPFLSGAINRETGAFKISLDCKKYEDRYFEIGKDSALWSINFDLYGDAELDSFRKTINVDEIISQVKSGKLTSKTFTGDRKEQIMFAHLMFNNGIMMTRGCFAGNICGLTYFKKE